MSSNPPAKEPVTDAQLRQVEESLLDATRGVASAAIALSKAVSAYATAEEVRLLERRSTRSVSIETDREVARARESRDRAMIRLESAMDVESSLRAIHQDMFGRSG